MPTSRFRILLRSLRWLPGLALAGPGSKRTAADPIERQARRRPDAVLVLFEAGGELPVGGHGFVRLVDRNDAWLKPFATFLKSARPRCGLIRDRQKSFLFAGHETEIGSAALVPLGQGSELGFLVIGSADKDYFHPGKSMDLLGRLGELVAVALTGRLSGAAQPSPKESEL